MQRFRNILYAAETGLVSNAFRHAVDIAERNGARLTAISVMDPIPPYLNRLTPQMLRQVRIEETEAALKNLREWAAGRVDIETRIVEGKPFLEIVRDVLRNRRDLVIGPAEGSGGSLERLLGTTDMHLLRKCPCPVWLCKSSEPMPIRRIAAAVDFNELDAPDDDTADPLNRMILEMAGSLALLQRSELHIVHAWEAPGETVLRSGRTGLDDDDVDSYVEEVQLQHRRWLDRLLSKAGQWLGMENYNAVNPKIQLPKGMAGEVVPMLVRELGIDLIVMGTVARTGIPGFFIGNTAEKILNEIDCSVLAVKPPGFVTPVTLEE